MSPDNAVRYVNSWVKKGNYEKVHITFFGGEPTINMQTVKGVVDYAKKDELREYHFHIISNGVMNSDTLDYLISNDFYMNISSDGYPEAQDIHRKNKRGEGTSKLIEKTLSRLRDANKPYRVRCTVTKDTVHLMPDAIRYLSNFGEACVHFEPVNMAGRAMRNSKVIKRPTSSEYVYYFIKALDEAKKCGIKMSNSSYMNLYRPTLNMCTATTANRIVVGYNGEATTCIEVQDCTHEFFDTLSVGYYDFDKKEFVIDQLKKDRLCGIASKQERCKHCFAKFICAGGCTVRNMHNTGLLERTYDFNCETTKPILKEILKRIHNNSLSS